MSAMNLHPPQTYSRLFRPWDSNRNASTSSCGNEKPTTPPDMSVAGIVKREYEAPTMSTATTMTTATSTASSTSNLSIKSEQSSFSGNESDRECASSSSCKSSYEDGLNNSFNGTSTPIMDMHRQLPGSAGSSPRAADYKANAIYSNQQLIQQQQPLQQQQQQMSFMPPSSELYYAAAAAAAVSGISNAPAAAAAAAFGMDAYTLGLMEQEYARVMAEDAQLKALNARKQRPKKFKCPHCDVAFSNNGQLKGHIRIHTGERPFKCDVETCGKTFTRNEELTRHKRIHTGLRPYPCTACGKKFGRRDHLKKHMKTHMPQERQLAPAIFVPMYPYLYGY